MRRPHLYIGISLYICVLIGGCAGRSAPAPVVLLNSQVSDGSEEYTKKTYKVQRGDTLYAVAWYTGNDYRDLAKYNQLSAPYTIFPGQVLNVTPPSNVATAPVIPKPKTNQSTTPTT
ncbi:MAG: LysM peptidoglycan-binding domain-containing protein, partial [Pseudomonadota bacterium]|nr:LysM peptidoglycan-binding domain-containing protein [Pseudomonadota bacterium]